MPGAHPIQSPHFAKKPSQTNYGCVAYISTLERLQESARCYFSVLTCNRSTLRNAPQHRKACYPVMWQLLRQKTPQHASTVRDYHFRHKFEPNSEILISIFTPKFRRI